MYTFKDPTLKEATLATIIDQFQHDYSSKMALFIELNNKVRKLIRDHPSEALPRPQDIILDSPVTVILSLVLFKCFAKCIASLFQWMHFPHARVAYLVFNCST